ncbi:MAG: alkaline phosphatase D family protein, partial [Nannocystaceae bacterium]
MLLFPRAAPPGNIRVWVGLTQQPDHPPPVLTWELNGKPARPSKHRWAPLRTGELRDPGTKLHTWTGSFEFAVAKTSTLHRVAACADASGLEREIALRSLPARIPDDGLHLLLSSCFCHYEAEASKVSVALENAKKACPRRPGTSGPDLALLMGDQVYLDLPSTEVLPRTAHELASVFERKYLENWRTYPGNYPSLANLLAAAPALTIPDDHEFWNNFPTASPVVQSTWSAQGRATYTAAARAMVDGFQTPLDAPKPLRLDIDPLSLLALDTRTHRTSNRLLTDDALGELYRWVGELRPGQVGILVTGQSLFMPRVASMSGNVTDWETPNYLDFKRIVTALCQAPCRIICLTGDVHWGRVIKAASLQPGVRPDVFEVIVSPLSLVSPQVRSNVKEP